MSKFIITGGKSLSGSISIQGSKNAALSILAASLISDQPCHFLNVPEIEDVKIMLEILKSLGVSIEHPRDHEYILHAKNVTPEALAIEKIGAIRASVIIMGALAARTQAFSLVVPGGDQIGARPLESHFDAFTQIGFKVIPEGNNISIERISETKDTITLPEISVTATINALLALSRQPKTVTIYCAAQDHSVVEVERFLQRAGATIEGVGTHTITITGTDKPTPLSYTVMPDPIETGTFISLAAATRSELTLENVSPDFLRLELQLFKHIGITMSFTEKSTVEDLPYTIGTLKIHRHNGSLKPVRHLHNMPAPGIIPDLLPPIAVLLTQAEGTSLIHDWMYEGRLRYIGELVKMGASANILDSHRAVIIGPTKLFGKEITSYDIRAGATLIIAALVAEGESCINDVYHIDRGYQQIETRLSSIGATITRK